LHARRRRNRTANKAIDFSLDFSDLDTIGGGALSGRSEAANALAEHCEMHSEGLGGGGIGNVIEVGVLLQFHSNMSNVGGYLRSYLKSYQNSPFNCTPISFYT